MPTHLILLMFTAVLFIAASTAGVLGMSVAPVLGMLLLGSTVVTALACIIAGIRG